MSALFLNIRAGTAVQDMVLEAFHPLISRWFLRRFEDATPPQRRGWPLLRAGLDTLIAAPTGSGKTLTAFLGALDDLVRRALDGTLEDRTYVLYVSPLKALSNDVSKNLAVPLSELAADDPTVAKIRVAVRTGDTPASERAKMAKRPPHILVTTPESLYILLTSGSGRAALAGVRTLIVDEIHAMADDKRGAHLALSLERLEALVAAEGGPRPQRIGLSATQKPIERIGQLLVGDRALPAIVDAGFARELDLGIEVPNDELGAVATHEMMAEFYERIVELTKQHRTTLVFTNTRRLCERVAHHLSERLGEDKVAAHHGSLSRETRLSAEMRLKAGHLSVIVATASLELGIDVGEVDLVIQLGSPRNIATFLQRVGRSGHCLGAIPKGRLFAMTRDQLIECGALVRSVKQRILDEVEIPKAPLDVLAQQIVAAASVDDWNEDALFETFRRAHSYRELSRRDFDRLIEMLADGIVSGKGRRTSYLHRDRINGTIRGRKHARLVAVTSGGAIPDNAAYSVIQDPEGTFVGTLDEDFAIESMAGDIFQLGNTSWRIRRLEAQRVRVEDAAGLPPTIPFWRGEAPARTKELSEEVSALRLAIGERLDRQEELPAIAEWLSTECHVPRIGAEQMILYIGVSKKMLGAVPSTRCIVAERFFDEGGGMQLVLHAPFGGRINKAWGLVLRKRFCKTFNFELQAAATDDGIIISLGPVHSFPLITVFDFVPSNSVEKILTQAVMQTPIFGVRWKWTAQRSLAVPRYAGGKKVPPPIMRMRTDDLLTGVFPMAVACQDNVAGPIELPDHPLIEETMRDCLTEAMDRDGLIALLQRLERGEIELRAIDTAEPSPLCHELVNANPYAYLDDAPLEERRARAVQTRRGLPPEIADGLGAFDPEAIATADREAAPSARNADELHDALMSLVIMGPVDDWAEWMRELIAAGRATRVVVGSDRKLGTGNRSGALDDRVPGWIAAEKLHVVRAAFAGVRCDPELPPLPFEVDPIDREAAQTLIVRAKLESCGPRTAAALSAELGLSLEDTVFALHALEAEGAVLRGRFSEPDQWCDRRILARIHRLTIGKLRKEIEPVTPADLMRFLFRWQHVSPGTQLSGLQGVLQIIGQLQGFESAAPAWERDLLASRIESYDPAWLDALTLGGEIGWGRLEERDGGDGAQLTRAMPVTLFLRDAMAWLVAPDAATPASERKLTPVARGVLAHLEDRGASFLKDIGRALGEGDAAIEDALRELVYAGLVTSDGFAGLRGLLDRAAFAPPRFLDRFAAPGARVPAASQRFPAAGPGGRWSLLRKEVQPSLDPSAFARQLLLRYGIVFRDLLAREPRLPPWRDLLMVFRRMEAKGEIRGGRFVSSFMGEQFALPEAVEALRSVRRSHEPEVQTIAATDPLNLVGITTPGNKVPAVSGRMIVYKDGVPDLAAV
jgi:ATP-dependent helicase Lhr and Lhr-like helicase